MPRPWETDRPHRRAFGRQLLWGDDLEEVLLGQQISIAGDSWSGLAAAVVLSVDLIPPALRLSLSASPL